MESASDGDIPAVADAAAVDWSADIVESLSVALPVIPAGCTGNSASKCRQDCRDGYSRSRDIDCDTDMSWAWRWTRWSESCCAKMADCCCCCWMLDKHVLVDSTGADCDDESGSSSSALDRHRVVGNLRQSRTREAWRLDLEKKMCVNCWDIMKLSTNENIRLAHSSGDISDVLDRWCHEVDPS